MSSITAKLKALTGDQLLARYLTHCYLYYEMSETRLTDQEFDELADALRDRWNEVGHPHKELVDYDSLKETTSGFYIKYPSIIKGCAKSILEGRLDPL